MSVRFLSYLIDKDMPGYGGQQDFRLHRLRAISAGDTSNNSKLEIAMHSGTHIDFPYHFFDEGQRLDYYQAQDFVFNKVKLVELKPKQLIIDQELRDALEPTDDCQLLLIKTGLGALRQSEQYWQAGYGLAPVLADFLRERLPNLRALGFDFISLSSYQHRELGRKAHQQFLRPEAPLLLIEDMDLSQVSSSSQFQQVIVAPIRVANADGAPVTVFGMMS